MKTNIKYIMYNDVSDKWKCKTSVRIFLFVMPGNWVT